MTFKSGKHFLQIPGPSNVPDRVLRAIDHPTIDHRGPDFGALATTILADLKRVFKTNHPVVIFPASGTGAWEAALVNTLSLNDKILMFETGQFASLWRDQAKTIGFQVDFVSGDWRHGVSADKVEQILKEDKGVIEDLIIAATNNAKKEVEGKTQDEMSKITGGIKMPPGFKFPM